MDKTANDKTANAHDTAPESMSLALVIESTNDSTRHDTMYFGYNELKRQGDWDEQIAYLQQEIQAKHPGLNADDAQTTVALRNVLRAWHPGLASQGRFTIQIRGALGSKDADAARAAPESAALQASKMETLEADRRAAEVREQARLAEKAHKSKLAEQEKKAEEQQRRAADALRQAVQERDTVQRQWEQAKEALGLLETEMRAHQYEQAAAQPQDDQIWAQFNELQMRFHDLEEQLDAANAKLKATGNTAGSAPSWHTEQGLGATSTNGTNAQSTTADVGPQYPGDKEGPLE